MMVAIGSAVMRVSLSEEMPERAGRGFAARRSIGLRFATRAAVASRGYADDEAG